MKRTKDSLKYLLLFLSGFLISCETILEDIPGDQLIDTKAQIVIASFISPQDSEVMVKVTESSPLFSDYKRSNAGFVIDNGDTLVSDESNVIPDAEVMISNGTINAKLEFDKIFQVYKISTRSFPIRSGITYNLQVKSKGRVAEAKCVVPLRRPLIASFAIDSVYQSGFGINQKGFRVQFRFSDVQNQADFYRVRAYLEYEYLRPLLNGESGVIYEPRIGRTAANWNGRFTDTDAYIDDANRDGFVLESPVGIIFPQIPEHQVNFNGTEYNTKLSEKRPKIVMEVLSIEENYRKYHLSIIKHENTENNPFAEPYPVFTNVKGGLGCFGGSNRRIQTIQL